jgi:hypothetical protein
MVCGQHWTPHWVDGGGPERVRTNIILEAVRETQCIAELSYEK